MRARLDSLTNGQRWALIFAALAVALAVVLALLPLTSPSGSDCGSALFPDEFYSGNCRSAIWGRRTLCAMLGVIGSGVIAGTLLLFGQPKASPSE